MHHTLCKNCEHTFEGNFCSNCGQKTNTIRLNWHFVKEELQYTFLHINKGFLYSVKELLTRPGETVREYLEGKRVKHYKPILLVFVLAGLNGLLSQKIDYKAFMPKNDVKNIVATEMPKIMNWIFSHYALVELALLPIFSLCSWLAFKKYGYNYVENIIINCFASAQRLLIGLITIPLMYLIDPKYLLTFSSLISIPVYGVTIWLYLQLYKKHEIGNVILRLLLFGFLATMVFFAAIIIATIVVLYYMVKTGQLEIN